MNVKEEGETKIEKTGQNEGEKVEDNKEQNTKEEETAPIIQEIKKEDNAATIKQCAEEYLKVTCPKVVFVYTGLKVGSTSLVSSFRIFASKKINVFHFHNENMLPQKFKDAGVTINDLIHYCATVLDKKVYVIDVYRTPIEKKISTYFERMAVYHFNAPENVVATYSMDMLIKRFNQLFPYIGAEDYLTERYGEKVCEKTRELFQTFPHMQHYLAFDCGMVKYIKLRLMDSAHWGSILSTIFGIHIEVVTDYASDKKVLGNVYATFKKEYKIPDAYLAAIKDADPHFAYYLSDKERTAYVAKWDATTTCLTTELTKSFTEQEYMLYSQISRENSYMDKVERTEEHYLDEGCVCDACKKRRKEVAEKIIAAPHHPINASHRIHHREAVKKHMIHRMATNVTNSMASSVALNGGAGNGGNIRMRNTPGTGIRLRKSGRNRRKSRSRSYSVRMKLF